MQVRIGRMRANDKLALHLEINGATCSTVRPVSVEARTTHDPAERCRSCWTPKRIAAAREAVKAARAANAKRTASSHHIVMDKISVETRLATVAQMFAASCTLSVAGFNTDYDEERAEIAARHAAANAPVKPLSAFGAIKARNLRTLPQPVGRETYVNKAA